MATKNTPPAAETKPATDEPKPQPDLAGVDAAKAATTGDEASNPPARPPRKADNRQMKAEDPAPTADAPFPTQADLDAMRAGTYRTR